MAPVNVRNTEELGELLTELESAPFCEGCAVVPTVSSWSREPAVAHAISAWTLIRATNSREVAQALRGIEAVNQVYETVGEYSVVANLGADEFDALQDTLIGRIQTVKGVRRTETLASFKRGT